MDCCFTSRNILVCLSCCCCFVFLRRKSAYIDFLSFSIFFKNIKLGLRSSIVMFSLYMTLPKKTIQVIKVMLYLKECDHFPHLLCRSLWQPFLRVCMNSKFRHAFRFANQNAIRNAKKQQTVTFLETKAKIKQRNQAQATN